MSEIPDDAKLLENYKLPERDYVTRKSAYSAYEDGGFSYSAPPADEIPLPDDEIPAPEDEIPVSAYAPSSPSSRGYAAVQTAPAKTVSAYTSSSVQASAPAKKGKCGLFLRVSGSSADDCVKAKKMCSIFEGGLPLILYYTDEARYDFQSGIRTDNNPDLVRGLKKLLGEKNVVVKL